jgi:hypothetical protein
MEDEWAGVPGQRIRQRYKAAAELGRVRGKLSALVINDLDAGVGVFANTQRTVNNQIVIGTLMALCDDPNYVEVIADDWRTGESCCWRRERGEREEKEREKKERAKELQNLTSKTPKRYKKNNAQAAPSASRELPSSSRATICRRCLLLCCATVREERERKREREREKRRKF